MTETADEDNLRDATASPAPDVDGTDDLRRVFLRQWLTANERSLRTALRPIAGAVAGVRGVSGAEAADDLLIEVVGVALGRAFARYDLNYQSPLLWLLRIAHLVCRRWRDEARTARDRTAAPGGGIESQENPLELIPGPDIDDPAHSVVDRAWAMHRLARLSPEDRGIVQHRIIEDLPYEEAAKRLGISEGAARVRYHRAVERLRRQEAEDNNYGYPAGQRPTGTKSRSRGGGRNEEAHE